MHEGNLYKVDLNYTTRSECVSYIHSPQSCRYCAKGNDCDRLWCPSDRRFCCKMAQEAVDEARAARGMGGGLEIKHLGHILSWSF